MTSRKTTPEGSDFVRRAYAPVAHLNEVVAGNVERYARFQYEVAGDLLQFGLDQLGATVKARDLPTLFALQREIATKFVEKAQLRQQGLAELAAESQAGFARWFDETGAAVTGKAT
jgi:hypothetical protein